jgi:ClpP class serine protease
MSKQIPHIIEKVMYAPWLITAGGYKSVLEVVQGKMDRDSGIGADITLRAEDFGGGAVVATVDSEGIATIPIQGILGQRLSGIEKMCGGTDYLDIERATREAIDKKYAKGVLYAFDSSGGMVRGCADLADFIKGLSVPTAAYTDSRCNSAAYWLASACDEVMSSTSADVGSIGVILPWIDQSKIWEVEGLKYEPFVNEGAELKGAGGGPALTDPQKRYLQESVNYVGEKFQQFVGLKRKVKPEVFRAGTYFGEQALDVGLVDKLGTSGDAYQSLLTRVKEKRNGDRAPVPMKIQVAKMTKDELKAQHPELYATLVQENESAAQAAAEAVRAQERNRLAELDGLAYTPECKALVDTAKAGTQTAKDIAVQVAELLSKEIGLLKVQVGVYKGALPATRIAGIDPGTQEGQDAEKTLAAKLGERLRARALNGRN